MFRIMYLKSIKEKHFFPLTVFSIKKKKIWLIAIGLILRTFIAENQNKILFKCKPIN
jgi:hypothetical protein